MTTVARYRLLALAGLGLLLVAAGQPTDAGHNLEVAKLLWAKARAKRPPGERDPEWDESPQNPKRPPHDPRPPQDSGPDGSGDGPKNPQPGAKLEWGKGPDAATVAKET